MYHCVCCLISTDRNTTDVAIKHTLTAASLWGILCKTALQKRNSFSLDFAKSGKHLCVTMTHLGHTVTVSTKQHRAVTYCSTGTKEHRSQETIHFIWEILQGIALLPVSWLPGTPWCNAESRAESLPCVLGFSQIGKNLPPKWPERCPSRIPSLNPLKSPEFLPGCLSALIPRARNKEMTLQEPLCPNKSSRACPQLLPCRHSQLRVP